MEHFIEVAREWTVTKGLEFAKDLVASLVILVVAYFLIKIFRAAVSKGLDRNKALSTILKKFLINVLGKALWVLAWVLVIAQMGVEVGPLIAGLGVAGFITGFALQDTLGNFAAGLMLLANDPFQVGDFVEIGGVSGTVQELNTMAVTLHTSDNKKVIMPNKVVWGSAITNYSATGTRRVDMKIGISYSSDISKAREIILGILKADSRVMQTPAPLVEVVEMADSSVNLVVRPWVKTSDYWAVHFATQQKVKEAFDANGIEIPFPQRVVHLIHTNAGNLDNPQQTVDVG